MGQKTHLWGQEPRGSEQSPLNSCGIFFFVLHNKLKISLFLPVLALITCGRYTFQLVLFLWSSTTLFRSGSIALKSSWESRLTMAVVEQQGTVEGGHPEPPNPIN